MSRIAGQWQAQWPVNDRGLQYGDGLFETLRLNASGDAPLWLLHRQRLELGCQRLAFPLAAVEQVEEALGQLDSSGCSAAKILLTRGGSERGYGYPVDDHQLSVLEPNIQIQLFDAPGWRHSLTQDGLTLGVSPVSLSRQPLLAGLKHLNRLEQVMARAQFGPGWDEAVMLDTDGYVVEACMSNLYWAEAGRIYTPALSHSGVDGTVRRWLCERLDIDVVQAPLDRLQAADGVWISNALMGIVAVGRLENVAFDLKSPVHDLMMARQLELEALF